MRRGTKSFKFPCTFVTKFINKGIILINIYFYFRYNECRDKIMPYLKKLGFNPAKDLSFLPVSGQTGQGLLQRVSIPYYKAYKWEIYLWLLSNVNHLSIRYLKKFVRGTVVHPSYNLLMNFPLWTAKWMDHS